VNNRLMPSIRLLSRSVFRWLIVALLFGQLAVAAYACPSWAFGAAITDQSSASVVPLANVQGAAVANCDDAMGAMDPELSNLCAEHCKGGDDKDNIRSVDVPVARLRALYEIPRPLLAPVRRPTATTAGVLAFAFPPHAILHCVLRT